MVKPFQFSRVPKIFFKNGIIADLPAYIQLYGNKIALVTGKSSFVKSPHAQRLFNDFVKAGIEYHIITVSGEPSPDVIDQAVKSLYNEDIKLVVGIGGGSVIDAGKALSAMMYKSESVKEFLEEVGTKNIRELNFPTSLFRLHRAQAAKLQKMQ